MPSFSEIVGVIVSFVVLSVASGHGDWVWRRIAQVHHVAVAQSHQRWGCPSLAGKIGCSSYNSLKACIIQNILYIIRQLIIKHIISCIIGK